MLPHTHRPRLSMSSHPPSGPSVRTKWGASHPHNAAIHGRICKLRGASLCGPLRVPGRRNIENTAAARHSTSTGPHLSRILDFLRRRPNSTDAPNTSADMTLPGTGMNIGLPTPASAPSSAGTAAPPAPQGITVYCAASPGTERAYQRAAECTSVRPCLPACPLRLTSAQRWAAQLRRRAARSYTAAARAG
jgi:hypothetical protein